MPPYLPSRDSYLLNKGESQIFEYEIIEGGLRPKYELYWQKRDGAYNTFLRLDP